MHKASYEDAGRPSIIICGVGMVFRRDTYLRNIRTSSQAERKVSVRLLEMRGNLAFYPCKWSRMTRTQESIKRMVEVMQGLYHLVPSSAFLVSWAYGYHYDYAAEL